MCIVVIADWMPMKADSPVLVKPERVLYYSIDPLFYIYYLSAAGTNFVFDRIVKVHNFINFSWVPYQKSIYKLQ